MQTQPATARPTPSLQPKRCPCNQTGCRVADLLTAKVAAVNAVESVFAAASAEYDEALSECLGRWRARKSGDLMVFDAAYRAQGGK